MAKHTITMEADSLEEARAQARLQVPDGESVLSEEVLSDGSAKTVVATADTLEEAKQKALGQVPAGASVVSTKELAQARQETVDVVAADESAAGRQARSGKGASTVARAVRLVRAGSKGFLGLGRTPNQYAVDLFTPAAVEVTYRGKARIALTVGDASERTGQTIAMAEALAGGWPAELARNALDNVDLDKLIDRLKGYQERAYGGALGMLLGSGAPSKPEYRVVGGRVGRMSNPVEDIKLVSTARMLAGGSVSMADFEKMGRLALQVIEHYAGMRLSKFLFLLPRARENTRTLAAGGKAIVIIEEVLIDVYKGVENLLLEIYDELGEGQCFDDGTVTRKLLGIVAAAR